MHGPLLALLGAILASLALSSLVAADPTAPPAADQAQAPTPAPPAPPAPRPRVILLRGALGVFSRGLDSLASRLRAEGMEASVYPYTQWSSIADGLVGEPSAIARPLVLIGHSFGADAVLAMANRLRPHGRHVDLTVTLENVAHTQAPDNIGRALNFYSGRTRFSPIPLWRGLPLTQTANVENINLRERRDIAPSYTGHGNIDDSPHVQQYVLERIQELTGARAADAGASSPGTGDVEEGVIVMPPDAAPPTMSLRIVTPQADDIPPLRARVDEPLAIPGEAPGVIPRTVVQRDTGYSPAGVLQREARPAFAERVGAGAAVPAQPTSRGQN